MATIAQLPTYITVGLDNEYGITLHLYTTSGIDDIHSERPSYMDGAGGNDGNDGNDGIDTFFYLPRSARQMAK